MNIGVSCSSPVNRSRPRDHCPATRARHGATGEAQDNDVETFQKYCCTVNRSVFWLGHERNLRQVPTLLVEGEKSETGHSDHRNVPAGCCDGGQ